MKWYRRKLRHQGDFWEKACLSRGASADIFLLVEDEDEAMVIFRGFDGVWHPSCFDVVNIPPKELEDWL